VPIARPIAGLALLALLGVPGCASPPSSGGSAMPDIEWPSKDGGTTTELPPSVNTVRIVFETDDGSYKCCVAVEPDRSSGSARTGLAVLTDLPIGDATVIVAGFQTDNVPAVHGGEDNRECSTSLPPTEHRGCVEGLDASPAFESPPQDVTIIGGVQTDLPEVPTHALPFVLAGFIPQPNDDAEAPVQFDLKVVDALTTIRPDSVGIDVTFNVPSDEPPLFRAITKNVPIQLFPCDDDSDNPDDECTPTGSLDVAGVHVLGKAPELPEGPVEARIVAENFGSPPRGLDFRYMFNVLATPTATATATPESTVTTAEISNTTLGAGSALEGGAPSPPAGRGWMDGPAAPAATARRPPHSAAIPTPTATPGEAP